MLKVAGSSSSAASSTSGYERGVVRVTDAFDQLDTYLGSERGPDGEPSATDFIVLELPPIVERFATDFDALPEIVDGVAAGRLLITSVVLVRARWLGRVVSLDARSGLRRSPIVLRSLCDGMLLLRGKA